MNRHGKADIEDALKHLHECEYEHRERAATLQSVAGALGCGRDRAVQLLERMEADGLVEWVGDAALLTNEGRIYARRVIRAHRLYETYLARQTGVGRSEWHTQADRVEHGITDAEADALDDRLGYPRFDPHGDPIPTHAGDLPILRGVPLSELPVGRSARVIHIEDEPESIGRKLAQEGFAPGMRVKALGMKGAEVQVAIEGRTVKLERPAAAQIQVVALSRRELQEPPGVRLSGLEVGEEAKVLGLSPACIGAERTRLLDLGFVPGSIVGVDFKSPMGKPIAYRVRGTLIALRPQQAEFVLVERKVAE